MVMIGYTQLLRILLDHRIYWCNPCMLTWMESGIIPCHDYSLLKLHTFMLQKLMNTAALWGNRAGMALAANLCQF